MTKRNQSLNLLRIGSAAEHKLAKGFRCFPVLAEMEVTEAPNNKDWFTFSKKKGEYFPMALFDEDDNVVTIVGETMSMKVESSIDSLPTVVTECPQMKGIYWFFRVLPHVAGTVTLTFSVKDRSIAPLVYETKVTDPNATQEEAIDTTEQALDGNKGDELPEAGDTAVEKREKRKSHHRKEAKPTPQVEEVKKSHHKRERTAAVVEEVDVKEESPAKTPSRGKERDRKRASTSRATPIQIKHEEAQAEAKLEEDDDDDNVPRKRSRTTSTSTSRHHRRPSSSRHSLLLADDDDGDEEGLLLLHDDHQNAGSRNNNIDEDEDYPSPTQSNNRLEKGRLRRSTPTARAGSSSHHHHHHPDHLPALPAIAPYPLNAVEMFVKSIQPPPLIDPLNSKHRLEQPFIYTPLTPQLPHFPASIHHVQTDLLMGGEIGGTGNCVFKGIAMPVNLVSYLHRDHYTVSVMLAQHTQTHAIVTAKRGADYIGTYPVHAATPSVTQIFLALQQKCAHVLAKTHMFLMMRKLFEDVFLDLVYEHERDIMEKAYVEKRLMGDVVGVNFFLRFLVHLLANMQTKATTVAESGVHRVKGPLHDVEKLIEHGFRLLDDNYTAWFF